MLATLLISLSGAVAVLTLLDLFMSNAQKTWLSNVVTKAWDVLDEAKSWSFTDWLKQPRARWWLAISLGVIMASYQIFMAQLLEADKARGMGAAENALGDFLVGALTAIVVVFLSRLIFARLLNLSWGRLAVILFCALAATVLITVCIEFLFKAEPGSFFILGGVGLIMALFPILIVLFCVLTIILSIAVAYIASAILYVGEFVVRRIAEYPKGPILALSALFGGIIALIKAFG
jgi:hypothetical protein